MLVKLHCRATQDITMLRDQAQYLLGIVGKRIGTRGVIACNELPEAINKLEAAIQANGQPEEPGGNGIHHASVASGGAPGVLARRAYPLLDMMREARRMHADILWGV
uniref:DUF1840 domain-containing protein n=1 Tax=Cupriavidus yeoncheonensis TaxID=1462994 RepID=UPI003F49930D